MNFLRNYLACAFLIKSTPSFYLGNMKKLFRASIRLKNICALLSIFLTTSAIAMQCPGMSDWKHVTGEDWELSRDALADGWKAGTYPDAVDSGLNVLPNVPLLVVVSRDEHKTATCDYALEPGVEENVIQATHEGTPVNIDTLSRKYFRCTTKICICKTSSSTPENCQWQWK